MKRYSIMHKEHFELKQLGEDLGYVEEGETS